MYVVEVRVLPALVCRVCWSARPLSRLHLQQLCFGISRGQKVKYEIQIEHFEQLCRYLFIKHNK